MQNPDETALRRPDFDGAGYWVELGDGVQYCFPAVRVRVFPAELPDGSIAFRYRPYYADAMEPDLDVMFGVVPATGNEILESQLRIAAWMLRRNYDLPAGYLGKLLGYILDDPASQTRLDRIARAILGRDPDEQDDDPDQDAPVPKDDPASEPTVAGS